MRPGTGRIIISPYHTRSRRHGFLHLRWRAINCPPLRTGGGRTSTGVLCPGDCRPSNQAHCERSGYKRLHIVLLILPQSGAASPDEKVSPGSCT